MPRRTLDKKIILWKEYDEINLYVRHIFQLLVTWYTFFVAANLAAVGWIVSGYVQEKNLGVDVAFVITALAFFVNVLAIIACISARLYFQNSFDRLEEIFSFVKRTNKRNISLSKFLLPPLPISLYKRATILMVCSLFGNLFAWSSYYYIIKNDLLNTEINLISLF